MVQVVAHNDIAQSLPVFITGLGILAGVSFLALALMAYFIMRWVIKPMWRLRLGMVEIEEGNLDRPMPLICGSRSIPICCSIS